MRRETLENIRFFTLITMACIASVAVFGLLTVGIYSVLHCLGFPVDIVDSPAKHIFDWLSALM